MAVVLLSQFRRDKLDDIRVFHAYLYKIIFEIYLVGYLLISLVILYFALPFLDSSRYGGGDRYRREREYDERRRESEKNKETVSIHNKQAFFLVQPPSNCCVH